MYVYASMLVYKYASLHMFIFDLTLSATVYWFNRIYTLVLNYPFAESRISYSRPGTQGTSNMVRRPAYTKIAMLDWDTNVRLKYRF